MIQSANFYEAFFNNFCDSLIVIDINAKTIIEANEQACKVTGFQAEELREFPIERLFPSQDGVCDFWKLGTVDNKLTFDNLPLARKKSETVNVSVSATWIEWDSNQYLILIVNESDKPSAYGCSNPECGDALWSEQKDFPTIIGQSEKIRDVCRLIGSVAKTDATVLIQGESGTGKEVIANAIHVHSQRNRNSFVKVNCAALTETLLESELFGHVKGAFTGAIRDRCGRFKQADGG